MRYIDTWLSGLGLEYIIPKLKANGITTPKKLATLTLREIYEVVGVEDSEDRKKLYFLIQRLQTILQYKPDNEDENLEPKHNESEPTESIDRDEEDESLKGDSDIRYLRKNRRMSTSNTEAKDGSNEVKVEVPLSKQPSKVFVQKSENTGVSAAKETKQKKEMVMISPQQLTTHTKDDLVVEDMAIRVVVRKRPLSKGEENKGDKDIIEVRKNGVVMVHEPKTKVDLTKVIETQTFIFDDAFDSNDSNEEIYSRTIKHLVDFVFRDKGKASCFAYGQTGSGKTFSMMGSDPSAPNAATNNAGLYVLAARDIFRRIKTPEFNTLSIYVSCFEIYGTKLYDLLNGRNAIKCLEDSKQQVQVLGLSEHNVGSVEDILDLMVSAHSQRSVGTTGANAESSRSHQILQIVLKENSKGKKMKEETRKLSFIDLAGSERGADTASSSKQTRQEGAEINTSLLALKEVIRSLEKKNGYTPFRGSKLTQVLKDSFIGAKTRTCMLACIAPSHSNAEHTLNTLRYADRVKENDPREPADMKSPVKSTEIPPSEKIAFALPEKEVSLQDLSTNLKKAEKHSKSKAPITSEANKSDSRRKSVGNNSVKPHAEESRNESNTLFVKAAAKPTPKSKSSSTDLRIVDVETSKSKSEVKNSAYIRQMLSLLSAHKLSIAEMVEVMKDEMELVQQMENVDERSTELYVDRLDQILETKSAALSVLRSELSQFYSTRIS